MKKLLAIILPLWVFSGIFSQPTEIPLWPEGELDLTGIENNETWVNRSETSVDRACQNVHIPTLTVYLPTEDIATGTAVVICPGGGYAKLAIDKEGHDMARWLNSFGVAAMVLKYRLPRPEGHFYGAEIPLKDAQQAIRLVRSRAKEYGIDPERVGIMGFSAGGHLAACAGTMFDSTQTAMEGSVKTLSARPDFMILGYPVISFTTIPSGSKNMLLGDNPGLQMSERFSPERQITPLTPPAFIVHAWDDGVDVRHSLLMATSMKEVGISVEMHIYQKGGHGFGIRQRGNNVHSWPARCRDWMSERGLLAR